MLTLFSLISYLCLTSSFRMLAIKAPESSLLRMTSVTRNENFAKLQAGYLFPEIGGSLYFWVFIMLIVIFTTFPARRRNAYLATNPSAKLISLGIGDTTQVIFLSFFWTCKFDSDKVIIVYSRFLLISSVVCKVAQPNLAPKKVTGKLCHYYYLLPVPLNNLLWFLT